jgi:sugar/nucleoside kinase (ribokinase family)
MQIDTLHQRELPTIEIASVSESAKDVIGAGDAFLSGFLHSYLEDVSWERAAEIGCALAAQVVRVGRIRVSLSNHFLDELKS